LGHPEFPACISNLKLDWPNGTARRKPTAPADAAPCFARCPRLSGDATDIALWIAIGTAIAGIAVTQGALLLAHSRVSLIASGGSQMLRQRKSSALERKAETIRPSPEPAQESPRRGRKANKTREQALEILRNHAKMNGGALFASKGRHRRCPGRKPHHGVRSPNANRMTIRCKGIPRS
jgi:hypothetical protein